METLLSVRCGCGTSTMATNCMSCSSTTAKGAVRLPHLHLRSSQGLSNVLIRTTTVRTSATTPGKRLRNVKNCAQASLAVMRSTTGVEDAHCEAVEVPVWAALRGLILTWCHIARHRRCVQFDIVLHHGIITRCSLRLLCLLLLIALAGTREEECYNGIHMGRDRSIA